MALSICRSLAKNRFCFDAAIKPLVARFHHVQVSKTAPDFKGTAVVNGAFKEIQLADYKGKYVYLFFYPLDFTFVCPTEIIAFNDRAKEFQELGTELIACSVDSHFSHLAWANSPRKEGGLGKVTIPLLSDLSKQISKDYNVLLDNGIALRGSFLIDGQGVLKHASVNDLGVGRSVDEALRLIKGFQFVEKHGEVCPANWSPGKDTINTSKAKDYFSKNN